MDIQSETAKKYYEATAADRAAGSLAGNSCLSEPVKREETAREILAREIRMAEYGIMQVRELLDALPQKMPREAEAALVKILRAAGIGRL